MSDKKHPLKENYERLFKTKLNEATDPTKKEMLAYLKRQYKADYSDFDAEEAIYWFGYEYHGGQNSNLYSALSTSRYKPGRLMKNADDLEDLSKMMFDDLVDKFN